MHGYWRSHYSSGSSINGGHLLFGQCSWDARPVTFCFLVWQGMQEDTSRFRLPDCIAARWLHVVWTWYNLFPIPPRARSAQDPTKSTRALTISLTPSLVSVAKVFCAAEPSLTWISVTRGAQEGLTRESKTAISRALCSPHVLSICRYLRDNWPRRRLLHSWQEVDERCSGSPPTGC